MSSPTKVFIAHSNSASLNSLNELLKNNTVEVINSTKYGGTALRTIIREKPDFAILNYSLINASAFDVIADINKKGINTRFCVLYNEATYEDYLIAKSLDINSNIVFDISNDHMKVELQHFLEGSCSLNAFKNLSVNDSHKEKLSGLNAGSLEVLVLLTLYGEMKSILKKTGMDKDSLNNKVKEICDTLKFENFTQLVHWGKKNQKLIFDLAVKAS
ncbi:hypothetical protein [Patiriisocius marinus]|uniref:Response regulatory domain-containing protein n=1 Tax=Patiriisocius marinus TaxID=1397112 RepID=A0A5J4IX28_9FLAO|nr:hypothetical protein [Patiriisocius marinus]GER58003.1 hypothetical protein ULMA_01110 [Patiriisocius marinus]